MSNSVILVHPIIFWPPRRRGAVAFGIRVVMLLLWGDDLDQDPGQDDASSLFKELETSIIKLPHSFCVPDSERVRLDTPLGLGLG